MYKTLTKAELRVLLTIEEPIKMRELANKLGLSKSRLSTIINSLKRKGLVEVEGKKLMIVKPAENKVNHLLRNIKLEYSHIKLDEVLTDNSLKVISALKVNEPQPLWLIEIKAKVSRATLHRILPELMDKLIVGKTAEGYFLSERFAIFKEFADEYFYLQNSIKVKEFEPKASLAWSGIGELILATRVFKGKSVGEFQLTGAARFSEFGLPLISSGVYHYYWPAWKHKLSLEEIIVHTLRLDWDARELLYIIVLLKVKEFNKYKLKRLAAKFEVSDIVKELLEYLKGVDKPYPFPSREEVEELCRQYFGGFCRDNKRTAG